MNLKNYTLLCDFYELTMGNGYFENGMKDEIVYFDVFFRRVPDGGGFAIAAGLQQIVEYIKDLHFSPDDISFLKEKGIFSDGFLDYLSTFRFTGDIWAVPEGTAVFPREPIITVSAKAIEESRAKEKCTGDYPAASGSSTRLYSYFNSRNKSRITYDRADSVTVCDRAATLKRGTRRDHYLRQGSTDRNDGSTDEKLGQAETTCNSRSTVNKPVATLDKKAKAYYQHQNVDKHRSSPLIVY